MAEDNPFEGALTVSMAIPDPLRGPGRLFLWSKDQATFEQLLSLARTSHRQADHYEDHGCLAIHVHKDDMVTFLGRVRRDLSPTALDETRALFKSGDEEPTLSDFPKSDTLKTFIIFARGKWVTDIMHRGRLRVHYQPIVSARDTGQVLGHEGLARGLGAGEELIEPRRMLSAARDAGLLYAFDTAIHRLAIEGLARAKAPGKLFLNLSPSTATDPSFSIEAQKRVCADAGISPDRIVLEVTESEKLEDSDQLTKLFSEAREEGFRIALDDLGAGFSNMNLIHRLRPHIVKLDMDLTRNIHLDAYKAVIAQKIIEIAQSLGIRTIAEGVEKAEELDWLLRHDVEYVQGYLIGVPEELPRDTVDLARDPDA